jgi:F-type H+-transporting ATPase subunit gamma
MANVLDLRRRIRSVKNTRQITKAMKMVSAAKLRRAQERALAARPYARMITSVLESLTRRIDIFDPETGNLRHPLFKTREEKRVLVIVISGDKGFAGAFNANILKTAYQFISGNPDKEIDIEAVGRKSRDQMRRNFPAAVYTSRPTRMAERARSASRARARRSHRRPSRHAPQARNRAASTTSPTASSRYCHEEIDAAYIVYNEFKSVIQQRLVVEKLLPIMKIGIPRDSRAPSSRPPKERERAAEAAASAGISDRACRHRRSRRRSAEVRHGPGRLHLRGAAEELFNGLLPQYIFSMLYHAMTESVAAEHAARMTAMDSATNNASDMIDSLTLHMNRVRQAAITKEIIEIVSGAAAL